jgi:hypothetical protein
MQIYYTGAVGSQFVNIFMYGGPGAGKTPLAATCPAPLVVSTEPGLLSLRAANLPYVVAQTYQDAIDVLRWIYGSAECKKFKTIFFDSVSAISENIYIAQRQRHKGDHRKISPDTIAMTMEIVTGFQTIKDKHLVMTSKAMLNAETRMVEPFAAVAKLGPALPYGFDEVLFLSRFRMNDGQEVAALRCRENDYCYARDRSTKLDLWEPGNLTHIINKINGV